GRAPRGGGGGGKAASSRRVLPRHPRRAAVGRARAMPATVRRDRALPPHAGGLPPARRRRSVVPHVIAAARAGMAGADPFGARAERGGGAAAEPRRHDTRAHAARRSRARRGTGSTARPRARGPALVRLRDARPSRGPRAPARSGRATRDRYVSPPGRDRERAPAQAAPSRPRDPGRPPP